MKFDVHVCLVSNQPTPNFVPVLSPEFRPQEVVLVVTPQMAQQAEALAKVMKERCQVKVHQLKVDSEYDVAAIGERLFELLVNIDKDKVALNVTGGTKLMAIGAYGVFRDAGYASFYLTQQGEVVLLDSQQKLSLPAPKILIEDYLALHGFTALDKPIRQINQQWLSLAEELAKRRSLAQPLGSLNYEISMLKNEADLMIEVAQVDEQNMAYLLSLLERYGLARLKNNQLTFVSEKAKQYVNGTWFEEYVFHVVKSLPNVQDCALGLQIDLADEQGLGRNELDVVVMAHNALHVLECKTANFTANHLSKAECNEPIYKLDTLKRLGGLRTRTALVSYRELTKPMKKRASGSAIYVLQQHDLSGLPTLLKNWLDKAQPRGD